MSKRLTNAIRDNILQTVLEDTFSERYKLIAKLNDSAAITAYEELIPSRFRDAMNTLPDEYFHSQGTISCVTNKKIEGTKNHHLTFTVDRLMPACFQGYYNSDYDVGHTDTLKSIELYYVTSKALNNDKALLKAKLAAVLASVNTDKALLETWPESAQFIPWDMFPVKKALSITSADINNQIACSKIGDCA